MVKRNKKLIKAPSSLEKPYNVHVGSGIRSFSTLASAKLYAITRPVNTEISKSIFFVVSKR